MTATRYVTPLREGGSMPGLVEADDDGLYVVKFRGAGQGPKALVAEVVAGRLAQEIGLPVPEIVLVELDVALASAEPDPEIQDLVGSSGGLNAGLDFLPGALAFDEAAATRMDPAQAAAVVWLDALVMNVDRTPRNPNLLVWHGRVFLIDHGAALYTQHGDEFADTATRRFPAIRDHVLLPRAGSIRDAHDRLAGAARAAIDRVVGEVPAAWVGDPSPYRGWLHARLDDDGWVEEAEGARAAVA